MVVGQGGGRKQSSAGDLGPGRPELLFSDDRAAFGKHGSWWCWWDEGDVPNEPPKHQSCNKGLPRSPLGGSPKKVYAFREVT